MNKARAKQLLASIYNPATAPKSITTTPKVVKLTSSNKNEFVKIAFNTYVHKANLGQTWSIEKLDGSDYIVAHNSGVPFNSEYTVKSGEGNTINVIQNDEPVITFQLDASADAPKIATILSKKISTYTYLPAQVLTDAISYELKELEKKFVSADYLRKNAAGDPLATFRSLPMSSEAIQGKISSGLIESSVNILHGSAFKGAGLDKITNALSLDSKYKEAIGAYTQAILQGYAKLLHEYITSADASDTIDAVLKSINPSTAASLLEEAFTGPASDTVMQQIPGINMENLKKTIISAFNPGMKYKVITSQGDTTLGQTVLFMLSQGDIPSMVKTPKKQEPKTESEQKKEIIKTLEQRSSKVLSTKKTLYAYSTVLLRVPAESQAFVSAVTQATQQYFSNNPQLTSVIAAAAAAFVKNPVEMQVSEITDLIQGVPPNEVQVLLDKIVNILNTMFLSQERAFFGANYATAISGNPMKIKINMRNFKRKDLTDYQLTGEQLPADLAAHLDHFNESLNKYNTNDEIVADFIGTDPAMTTKEAINGVISAIGRLTEMQTDKINKTVYADIMDKRKNPSVRVLNSNSVIGRALGRNVLYKASLDFYNTFAEIMQEEHPDLLTELSRPTDPNLPSTEREAAFENSAQLVGLTSMIGASNTALVGSIFGRTEEMGGELITLKDIITENLQALPQTEEDKEEIIRTWGQKKNNYHGLFAVSMTMFDKEFFGEKMNELMEMQNTQQTDQTLHAYLDQLNGQIKAKYQSILGEIEARFKDAVLKAGKYKDEVQTLFDWLVKNEVKLNVIPYIMVMPEFQQLSTALLPIMKEITNPKELINAFVQEASKPEYAEALAKSGMTPDDIKKDVVTRTLSAHILTTHEDITEGVSESGSGEGIRKYALAEMAKHILRQGPTAYPNVSKAMFSTFQNSGLSAKFAFNYPQSRMSEQMASMKEQGMDIDYEALFNLQDQKPVIQSILAPVGTDFVNPAVSRSLELTRSKLQPHALFTTYIVDQVFLKDPEFKTKFEFIKGAIKTGGAEAMADVYDKLYDLTDQIELLDNETVVKLWNQFLNAKLLPIYTAEGILEADYTVIRNTLKTYPFNPEHIKTAAIEAVSSMVITNNDTKEQWHDSVFRMMPGDAGSPNIPRSTASVRALLRLVRFAAETGSPVDNTTYLERIWTELQQADRMMEYLMPIVDAFGETLMGQEQSTQEVPLDFKEASIKYAMPAPIDPSAAGPVPEISNTDALRLHQDLVKQSDLEKDIFANLIEQTETWLDWAASLARPENLVTQHGGRYLAHTADLVKNMIASTTGIKKDLLGGAHTQTPSLSGEEVVSQHKQLGQMDEVFKSTGMRKRFLEMYQKIWTRQLEKMNKLMADTQAGTIEFPAHITKPEEKQRFIQDSLVQLNNDITAKTNGLALIEQALSDPNYEISRELTDYMQTPTGMSISPAGKQDVVTPIDMSQWILQQDTPSKSKSIPVDTQHLRAFIEQATGISAEIYEKFATGLALIPVLNYKLDKTIGDLALRGAVDPAMEAYVKATTPSNYWHEFIYNYALSSIPGVSERFITRVLFGGLDKNTIANLQEYLAAPPGTKGNVMDQAAIQNVMSSVFKEVIKTGFTVAPADLASFITDRLAIQPEIESLGKRQQKTPNRDFINSAIDKALTELNFTGPRAENIKKRLWSRLGHATHTEEMQLLMEKITAIKWAAEGRDVESPEFADYNATKFAEAEAALNMQLISYLRDPKLMKAKKEPVVLGIGEYRFLNFKSDNTLEIPDLELILNNFEKIITDRLQTAQMADANLEQTKLTRGAYTDDDKNAAINYSKILYPKVFGKLDKNSVSEYTGIDTGLAEALGIPLDQLTLTMTFFTFKVMTISNYLSKFSDAQRKTEVEALAATFSSYGPALQAIATEFLEFAAANVPVSGQRFTMRDINKRQPGKKANTFTAWVKQAIDKMDAALPAPGDYSGLTPDSGSDVVAQIFEAQATMMEQFAQRLNEIKELARQSAELRIKIDQLMGGIK